jgi:hypothetical protein
VLKTTSIWWSGAFRLAERRKPSEPGPKLSYRIGNPLGPPAGRRGVRVGVDAAGLRERIDREVVRLS